MFDRLSGHHAVVEKKASTAPRGIETLIAKIANFKVAIKELKTVLRKGSAPVTGFSYSIAGLREALKKSEASLKLPLINESGFNPMRAPQINVMRVIHDNKDLLFPKRGLLNEWKC